MTKKELATLLIDDPDNPKLKPWIAAYRERHHLNYEVTDDEVRAALTRDLMRE